MSSSSGWPTEKASASVAASADAVDYARLTTPEERRGYYVENGYVVRSGLLDDAVCADALSSFRREIKPYRGHLYRQATANPEVHRLDSRGNMLNSLLNPVSVSSDRFPDFRAASETLLADDRLFAAVEELLGARAALVQSMYFEANPATWAHQDSYYLDAERPGELLGAWIALEDIEEAAGRFYVVPGSHRLETGRNRGELKISDHHDRYKQVVSDAIRDRSLELRAPPLERGDVLFWNSWTIHGALEPVDAGKTRNSYTAHYMPASSRLIQYQTISIALEPDRVSQHAVCRPKDQDRWANWLVMRLEIIAPRTFRFVKRKIINWKLTHQRPWPSAHGSRT